MKKDYIFLYARFDKTINLSVVGFEVLSIMKKILESKDFKYMWLANINFNAYTWMFSGIISFHSEEEAIRFIDSVEKSVNEIVLEMVKNSENIIEENNV